MSQSPGESERPSASAQLGATLGAVFVTQVPEVGRPEGGLRHGFGSGTAGVGEPSVGAAEASVLWNPAEDAADGRPGTSDVGAGEASVLCNRAEGAADGRPGISDVGAGEASVLCNRAEGAADGRSGISDVGAGEASVLWNPVREEADAEDTQVHGAVAPERAAPRAPAQSAVDVDDPLGGWALRFDPTFDLRDEDTGWFPAVDAAALDFDLWRPAPAVTPAESGPHRVMGWSPATGGPPGPGSIAEAGWTSASAPEGGESGTAAVTGTGSWPAASGPEGGESGRAAASGTGSWPAAFGPEGGESGRAAVTGTGTWPAASAPGVGGVPAAWADPTGGWVSGVPDTPAPAQVGGSTAEAAFGGHRWSRPATHVIPAAVVTVLLCWFVGGFALASALRVDERWRAGDYVGAQRASARAAILSWWGAVVGLVWMVLVAFIVVRL